MTDSPLHTATSPYLRQHASNPVRWLPWNRESLELARQRDVPIFLSVGYSTCHWCHVMAHESFEDHATAALLNRHFIPIKVDREERPDIDDEAMAATIAMTGRGGWPTSVFLEPTNLLPFYCGTYFPKVARPGLPSFTQLLTGIAEAWHTRRDDVLSQAHRLGEAVREQRDAARPPAPLTTDTVAECVRSLLAIADLRHGGFGLAPKFPQPVFIDLLLDARDVVDADTKTAIDHAVRASLDAMAMGGLHDHVGGGFHRYSVDATWTVPHFEKMLSDQGQLLRVYARAAALWNDPWYRDLAHSIVAHITSDLLDESMGVFHSALDADSDDDAGRHREGASYLWTPEAARDALGTLESVEREHTLTLLGLAGEANFHDPHHATLAPAWILRLAQRPTDADRALLARALPLLRAARAHRPQPSIDTKAIASWNALTIEALATAGLLLRDDTLLALATSTLRSLVALPHVHGRAARSWHNAHPSGQGYLEDAAARALAACAIARVDANHLPLARSLVREALAFDADSHKDNPDDGPTSARIAGVMSLHDGAMPSGYSLRLHALLDLATLSPDQRERDDMLTRVRDELSARSGRLADSPAGSANAIRALLRLLRLSPAHAAGLAENSQDQRHAAPSQPISLASTDVVEVLSQVESLTIREGEPAHLTLQVAIAPGYHLIAAIPHDDETDTAALAPFRVDIFHGSGVSAYCDYPAGTPQSSVPQSPRVYTGTFTLDVLLERDAPWQGSPLLCVRFQACSDTECLAPATVELDIALHRA